jgi:hypothetical protein
MLKKKLIESVRREAMSSGVGSVDDEKKITMREVEVALAMLWDDLLFLTLKDRPNDLNSFTKNYNQVEVKYDTLEKVYYCDLPAPVVQLPGNGGVRLVKPHGTDAKIYQCSHEQIDLFLDMDVYSHYDRGLWVKDADRILFKNFDWRSLSVRTVNLKLVVGFLEYDWNEDIPLPAGRETEFTNIVAQKLFKRKPLETPGDGI